jgi:hypothetical protein
MVIRVNDLKAAGSTCSVHWDDYSGISSQGGLLAGEVCEKRNREVEPEQHEPFESTLSHQQEFHHCSAVRGRRLSNRIAATRVPIKAWVGISPDMYCIPTDGWTLPTGHLIRAPDIISSKNHEQYLTRKTSILLVHAP